VFEVEDVESGVGTEPGDDEDTIWNERNNQID
jgi:hypothetical protein